MGIKAAKIFANMNLFWKICLPYKYAAAPIAPSCIKISKLLRKSDWASFKRWDASTRCPVEEMGRNSVIPSMSERRSTCKMFTKIFYQKFSSLEDIDLLIYIKEHIDTMFLPWHYPDVGYTEDALKRESEVWHVFLYKNMLLRYLISQGGIGDKTSYTIFWGV